MSKTKNRYYVVWEGNQRGIADSWDRCKQWIDGYAGAKYMGFATLDQAEKALQGDYREYYGEKSKKKEENKSFLLQLVGEPVLDSLSVDAACSGNPGALEYRGVYSADVRQVFHFGPYPKGTVNIGEFLALVHGLAYLKKHNLDLPVYTDSRTALAWVRNKKVKTELERDAETEELFRLVDRALQWLNNNACQTKILKWETEAWGEIPADFGRK